MLILDEPTNHLDIDARDELLNALNDFDGAVILVSHDRRLIEATADRLLLVADGKVEPFEGDLDDYRRFLLTGRQCAHPAAWKRPKPKPTRKMPGASAAEKRQSLKPLKERIEVAESQVAALQAEIAKLDKSLVRSPAVHQRSGQGQRRFQEAGRGGAQAGCRRKASGWRRRKNMTSAMAAGWTTEWRSIAPKSDRHRINIAFVRSCNLC